MMGSTASWALMATITRHFTGEIHTFEIIFFRSFFGTVFLLPWLFRLGFAGLRTQRFGMHMARGFTGLATIYMLFTAIALAPLGEVAAVISTRPVVGSLGAVLILHEVAHGRRWAATALAFAGALVIIRPGFSDVSLGVVLELVVYPALRHRLILNFQAEAENIGADQILEAVLKKVPRD